MDHRISRFHEAKHTGYIKGMKTAALLLCVMPNQKLAFSVFDLSRDLGATNGWYLC
jgi:hypothetical protein